MDFLKLANLRPGQPAAALADAIGPSWKAPEYEDLGCVRLAKKDQKKFSAKLNTDSRIGELSYSTGFPEAQRIEGLYVCMLLEKALLQRPQLVLKDQDDSGITALIDRSEAGYDILVHTNGKSINNITLRLREAIYPAFEPADPNLTKAFDIWPTAAGQLAERERGAQWAGGWTFGLPPGIQTRHWPLHPEYGYPLRHAFTLHVPREYRTQGEDLVALSFFVGDMAEDAPELDGFDPDQFEHHPHSFPMEDLIGRAYAGIWLTQQEFDGPLCQPPVLEDMEELSDFDETAWLLQGYAATFDAPRGPDNVRFEWPDSADLKTAFPIAIALREGDPNVGKPPRQNDFDDDEDDDTGKDGYVGMYSEKGEALGLMRFYDVPHVNHLGGTMHSVDIKEIFGPYCLEFHEDFAGLNFAGGDMQIDLKRMKLDWSH